MSKTSNGKIKIFSDVQIVAVGQLKLNPWTRILNEGTIALLKSENRRIIHFQGKRYRYAIVLWNCLHPTNRRRRHEVIHHKDGNPMNDHPSNLQKMTRSVHMKLHTTGERNPFYGKKHSEEAKEKMRTKATGRVYLNRKRKLTGVGWDIVKARRLRSQGKKWTEIGRAVGACPVTIQQSFQRRGLA